MANYKLKLSHYRQGVSAHRTHRANPGLFGRAARNAAMWQRLHPATLSDAAQRALRDV